MPGEDERCAAANRFLQIDEAFRRGDLERLRASVEDPELVPNGPMPITIGSCLVYAIYHSPLAFIKKLLEIGADPNLPADDGFPPLIAALSCARDTQGARKREDVAEILRLLLRYNADPNQRGINDCTPLHLAVADQNRLAIQLLLEVGADPELATRIDECETPIDIARTNGLPDIEAMLARRGEPARIRLRSGLTLLFDAPGDGEPVRRHQNYRVRLRLWLNGGEPVRWSPPLVVGGASTIDGEVLETGLRINRGSLMNGLFYGVEDMRIGGTRRLEIAPQLGYGSGGVPGIIPPNALLIAEITILSD